MLQNGGIERVLYDYMKAIRDSNIFFSFATQDHSGLFGKKLKEEGIDIIILPSLLKPFSYIKKLSISLKNGNYDIVHVHQGQFSFLPLLVSKLLGVRVRIVHIHWNKSNLKNKLILKILKISAILFANKYFACSREASDFLYGKSSFSRKKVFLMKNALDLSQYSNSRIPIVENKLMASTQDKKVIALIGRFTSEKNHLFAIEVFKEVFKVNKSCVLLFIGDGPEKENCMRIVDEYDLKNSILFLGERDDVPELLKVIDLIIQPSTYEGLGKVLIEAQAYGIRCLASSNIPKEVNLGDLIYFKSLNDAISSWASEVLNLLEYVKIDSIEILKEGGYDISIEKEKLILEYTNC